MKTTVEHAASLKGLELGLARTPPVGLGFKMTLLLSLAMGAKLMLLSLNIVLMS